MVRHAQASFLAENYDQLSPLGLSQSQHLGQYLAAQKITLSRVLIGPGQRHAQTWSHVFDSLVDAGLNPPAASIVPELDEHQGLSVAKAYLATHSDQDASGRLPQIPGSLADTEAALHRLLDVIRDWSRGQIASHEHESWEQFRSRALRALDLVCKAPSNGTTLVVTSGGTISAAVGWLLGLSDEAVIDIHSVLRNASLSEIRVRGRQRKLLSLNEVPHLVEPQLLTVI